MGEEKGGMNWEIAIDINTLLIRRMKQITSENLLYSSGNSMLCSDLNRKEIPKRDDKCIHISDSLYCMA